MFRRIDRLGAMGTSVVTISGGEPLLHPELDAIIARIRKNGIMAGLITNGYLLVADRIKSAESRRPGISADQHRQRHSRRSFDEEPESAGPEIETAGRARGISGEHQFGAGWRRCNPEDALTVAHRAVELGFTSTVGILHDHNGQLQPLGPREQEIFEEIMTLGKQSFTRINQFQHNIAKGRRTTGDAAPAHAICISARTAWCTIARSSAATQAFRWRNTLTSSATANFSRRRAARRVAPFPACIKLRRWISGARRNLWNPAPRHRWPRQRAWYN